MSATVRLKYHQPMFDLLGQEPVVSESARQRIEAVEQKCASRLPAAVREWYALGDGVGLLGRYALGGHARSLTAVLADFSASCRPEQPSPFSLRAVWSSLTD